MLNETLTHITNVLNTFFSTKYKLDQDKVIANQLVDSMGHVPLENTNKLVLTMIDIRKDNGVRQTTGFVSENTGTSKQPAAYHLELLLSGMFDAYRESLTFLSDTMELLQEKPTIFDRKASKELDGKVLKINIELIDISTEDAHHLWASLKTPKRPCLHLKARVLTE